MNCEGACEAHEGDVKRVTVTGFGPDAIAFDYCEAAVEYDQQSGFKVEEASND